MFSMPNIGSIWTPPLRPTEPRPADANAPVVPPSPLPAPASRGTTPLVSPFGTSAISPFEEFSQGAKSNPGTPTAPSPLPPDVPALLNKLPSEQRAEFNQVYEALESSRPQDADASKDSANLVALLRNGVVVQKDFNGQTLLDNLAGALKSPPVAALAEKGLDNTMIVRQLVAIAADPGATIYQGDDSANCVPASIEAQMAQIWPAELVRIGAGLMFRGEVVTAGGATMTVKTTDIGDLQAGRTAADAVIQGSFQAFASQFPPDGDASLGAGRFASGAGYGGGRFGTGESYGGGRFGTGESYGAGRFTGGSTYGTGSLDPADPLAAGDDPARPQSVEGGLTQNQAAKLYESLSGMSAEPQRVDDKNRGLVAQEISFALENRIPLTVGVTGHDKQGHPLLHEILLTGMRGDQVVVFDPGTGETSMHLFAKVLPKINALVYPSGAMGLQLAADIMNNVAMAGIGAVGADAGVGGAVGGIGGF